MIIIAVVIYISKFFMEILIFRKIFRCYWYKFLVLFVLQYISFFLLMISKKLIKSYFNYFTVNSNLAYSGFIGMKFIPKTGILIKYLPGEEKVNGIVTEPSAVWRSDWLICCAAENISFPLDNT